MTLREMKAKHRRFNKTTNTILSSKLSNHVH